MPKVSIGVPLYNGERHLAQTLDSLLGQTFFEIVISDNASTDASGEICRAYEKRDARVKYLRNEANIGAGRVALAAVKGDKTLAGLSEHFEVHANQISAWKQQLQSQAAGVFETSIERREAQTRPDVVTMQAKIGELALENDFLERALNKAGLLSAKR